MRRRSGGGTPAGGGGRWSVTYPLGQPGRGGRRLRGSCASAAQRSAPADSLITRCNLSAADVRIERARPEDLTASHHEANDENGYMTTVRDSPVVRKGRFARTALFAVLAGGWGQTVFESIEDPVFAVP